MIITVDIATSKSVDDDHTKRLARPIRFGESVCIAGGVYLVAVLAFRLARGDLDPLPLCLFGCLQNALVPGIVEVLRRQLTEEEHIVRLGCQYEAETKDLPARHVC